MNNLAVGFELLLTGVFIVFLVLLFLMYLMKAMSVLVGERPAVEGGRPVPRPLATEGPQEEELIALMTALGKVLPANQEAVVRIAAPVAGDDEEERVVATIAAALAAR